MQIGLCMGRLGWGGLPLNPHAHLDSGTQVTARQAPSLPPSPLPPFLETLPGRDLVRVLYTPGCIPVRCCLSQGYLHLRTQRSPRDVRVIGVTGLPAIQAALLPCLLSFQQPFIELTAFQTVSHTEAPWTRQTSSLSSLSLILDEKIDKTQVHKCMPSYGVAERIYSG